MVLEDTTTDLVDFSSQSISLIYFYTIKARNNINSQLVYMLECGECLSTQSTLFLK